MSVTVMSQKELDAALAKKESAIYIEAPGGVRLTLTNSDSSHVEARGSSHVVARGSSHVVARGSSHVEAWDSSHVVARDSSHVEAWDSSHVVARGSSHVVARKFTSVHLCSQRVELDAAGAVVDLTKIDFDNPQQWCEFHGVDAEDGVAYLYKAVGADWKSDYGADYSPGSIPQADDWNEVAECGNGLHFCAHPQLSLNYKRDATKFIKCGVRLDEMVCLGDKVKAKRVVVACVEVDRYGREVVGA